ncbi:hypothetical protein EV649_4436 [Kribbella sp. VKM Ac-2569]|uniref:hypothetical protein n=1 Tax=Kribbella sp. VKM Ac-2569 TaxID=2512220 RepID=UPI00102AEF38|nr:hypothetical protein [Kribbella sp. VKM Ac-2569]RZT16901.1 hypothetical protein EV649_4436 [Kribbella sp. VKM Ac-2569]
MGQRSPLVTLAATAVGLVGLLVVNSTQTDAPAAVQTEAAGPTSAPTTPPPTTPTTAAPTTPEQTPAAQNPVVYVGRTAGREATLAVAVKGAKAVAYVCDGRRVEAWLTGTFAAGKLVLRSRTGERLTGVATAKAASGELTLRGRSLRFTATLAGPPAGLYRAKNTTSTIGWIVLPDGSQVGIDNDGTPAAAPPLDPATRSATVNGAAVTAQAIAGDETF